MDDEILVSFGIITDIQYANVNDGWNYCKTKQRFYRNALNLLKEAIVEWNSHENISFLINLGDLIDGKNQPDFSDEALDLVLKEFDKFSIGNIHHCLGNHDLYNLKQEDFFKRISQKDSYYSFSPHPQILCLLLNSYDISTLANDVNSLEYNQAKELLLINNPNIDKNSPKDMYGKERRFLEFNGGISKKQQQWMEIQLNKADKLKQKVLIFTHIAIHPDLSDDFMCLLYNYEEIMDLIGLHPSVVAYISGHCHENGYAYDKNGIHHIGFDAVLESSPDTNAYGIIDIYINHLIIKGYGKIPSRTLLFK